MPRAARADTPATPDPKTHAEALLAWYDRHRRTLPWRAPRGKRTEPYRVWLSEVMLQQTTVATVGPRFARFLERWPTVEALAAAPIEAVLAEWAGLGYYARARNLHACARAVVERHGGAFPDDEAGLAALPGVGAYTAAAVAAIAFDRHATVVDGNVERVVARLCAIETPMPAAKPAIRAAAAALTPERRSGDYAQAMMDLGATLCTPRKPKCVLCPLTAACAARIAGVAEELPRRAPKPEKPIRRGIAFLLLRADGALLLRRRPPKGLLGGMMEAPSSEWRPGPLDRRQSLREAPAAADWRPLEGLVRHTFTHFHLELELMAARAPIPCRVEGEWVALDRLGDAGLPTVMRKVVEQGLAEALGQKSAGGPA